MDQLKVFLKQALKYRFWIAVGVSLLLPMIGFLVGAETINTETTKRANEIDGAKKEVVKYKSPGIVNGQYQPLAAAKKDVLVQDVDATWRKLFASQEPLLKWPAEVQDRFRKWGRKFPEDVDRNQVQSTIIDYTVAYPEFVQKIYAIFKPFNFDDGSGIVVAPEANALLAPATFSQDSPPDLTKIWSEQERLWVVTALLDAVAQINASVNAKDWDGAIIKQINLLDVGSATDQDQKSLAQGATLEPAAVLADPKAPAAPPASAPAGGGPGMVPGMMGMGGGASKNGEVLYLKTDSPQYKVLPIKLNVLVDQAKLANFLVGLENSPMAIEVNEVELAKPLQPVAKPAYGERSSFNMGSMASGFGGGRGDEMGGGGSSRMRGMAGGMGGRPAGYPGAGGGMGDETANRYGGMSGGAGRATPKPQGVDNRGNDDAKIRKEKAKKEKEAAAKAKGETKKIDQYYNVVEVTVYGRARFYMAPPPAPQPPPSTASTAPAPPAEAPAPAPNPTPDAAKAAASPAPPAASEPAKAEAATPKEGTPKPEPAPSKDDAPKAEPPKAESPAPKA